MRQVIPLFKHAPRSQAVYGSLVETFGPYSQHYTKIIRLILFYLNKIRQKSQHKTRTFLLFIYNSFVKFYSHSIVAGGLLVIS